MTTQTERYAKKIEHLLLIKTQPILANDLGVSLRTIQNWKNRPGLILLAKADLIDQLYNQNSGIIMPLLKKLKG